MRRYRTEIVVPEDRCVTLHLPLEMAAGHATLTIEVESVEEGGHDQAPAAKAAARRVDMEWWEEFESGELEGEESWPLDDRLEALEL